jgi:hypothetical protein
LTVLELRVLIIKTFRGRRGHVRKGGKSLRGGFVLDGKVEPNIIQNSWEANIEWGSVGRDHRVKKEIRRSIFYHRKEKIGSSITQQCRWSEVK